MIQRGSSLSVDEQALLDQYRDCKEREYAAGYEDALKHLVTALIWVSGPEKATPREMLASNLLCLCEREVIGNAPKHAACNSLRAAVEFYRRTVAAQLSGKTKG